MQVNEVDCTRRRIVLAGVGACVAAAAAAWPLVAQASAATQLERRILILGDSLSAEYGLARGTGWVALLQERLARQRTAAEVVNASISGETTSGGRSRLAALLKQHRPTHVVVELGANDALRGFPLRVTQDNLRAMVEASQAAGAKVLLVGMRVPPNYGRRYADAFAELFVSVSRERKAALVPFLLKDVADRPDARDWFQPDGIHPLAKAHPVMLDHVWMGLKPLL
ncbi:MAG: arylesterase [Burkholderiales bacterium]|nr:arylesterase [Burkholderiales bacterium]